MDLLLLAVRVNRSVLVSEIRMLYRRATESLFSRQVASTALSQGLFFLFSVANASITARWLGPEGRGQFALTLLIPGTLQLLLGVGISSANVFLAGSRRFSTGELTANSVTFALLGTTVGGLACIGMLTSGVDAVIAPGVPAGYLLLGMLALPLGLLNSNLMSVLQGLRLITLLNVMNVLQAVLMVALLSVLVICLDMGVAGAILAALISNLFVLACLARSLRRQDCTFFPRWDRRVVKATLDYGLKGWVGTFIQFLNYRFDGFLVNVFLGPTGLGIYGVSVTLAELLWQFPNSVGLVILPKAAGTSGEEMNRFTPRVFWIVLGICSTGAVGLTLFAKPAIRIFLGEAFLDSYVPMLALLPGVVLLGAGKVLANDIAGRGYPQYNSIAAAFAFLITVTLDLLLIPESGITGAAIASSVAYSSTFFISIGLYLAVSRPPLRTEGTRRRACNVSGSTIPGDGQSR